MWDVRARGRCSPWQAPSSKPQYSTHTVIVQQSTGAGASQVAEQLSDISHRPDIRLPAPSNHQPSSRKIKNFTSVIAVGAQPSSTGRDLLPYSTGLNLHAKSFDFHIAAWTGVHLSMLYCNLASCQGQSRTARSER